MIDESEGNYQQSTSTFKYRIIRLVVGVIFFYIGFSVKSIGMARIYTILYELFNFRWRCDFKSG